MKVCIIGGNISKVMKGEVVGGAEKQQALIIQGLKKEGLNAIVLEYELNRPKQINGIDFYPAWEEYHKSFFSKIKSIYNQLKQQEIKVVYARGTQIYIAFLYVFLKLKRSPIKLFWGIAGDHNLTSKYNSLRVNHMPSLYGKLNAGIIFNLSSILTFYSSDTIICQTKEQMERCKEISKSKSIIQISNIFSDNLNKIVKNKKNIIADAIWIGKFSGNKGEDILLKIAKDIPEMKIICLGHITDEFKKTEIYQQIKRQTNLILIGRVPNNEVGAYISQVDFVLNTSPSEGLSNVFLEAWANEKSVVSFKVDPNEYLSSKEAGWCAKGSYNRLIQILQIINQDKELLKDRGKRGREILIKNHVPEVILPKYYKLFTEVK